MKRWFALMLLVLAGTISGAPQPQVELSLQLPWPRVLPGVPFDIVVRCTNLSHHVVGLGNVATVTITPKGGVPVQMQPTQAEFAGHSSFALQPGESSVATISWDANWFHTDATVSVPGEYEVAVHLSGGVAEPEADAPVLDAGPLDTPSAHLTRVTPVGEDAVVWQRMLAAGRLGWPSAGFMSAQTERSVVSEIRTSHRTSGYYPYALLLDAGVTNYSDVTLDEVRTAAERFADAPAHARLLNVASMLASREAYAAAHQGRVNDAVNRFELAAAFAHDARTSLNPSVALHATRLEQANRRDGAKLTGVPRTP